MITFTYKETNDLFEKSPDKSANFLAGNGNNLLKCSSDIKKPGLCPRRRLRPGWSGRLHNMMMMMSLFNRILIFVDGTKRWKYLFL